MSWRDADRSLARGSAHGTRPGRAVSLTSGKPRRAGTGSAGAPSDSALAVFRPTGVPWQADLGWLLVVVLVAIAYVSVLHTVPWFLLIVVIGRLFVGLRLSRRVWIAVTRDQLEVLEGSAEVWSVPRRDVAAIHVGRDRASRVEFVDRSGAPLVTAPLMFNARQLARMADVLATPIIDHRG